MKRLKVLDGLRAAAVLIVMLSHAGLGSIIPGDFGVTIFFCLSGFLITTLMRIELETTGAFSFRGFYLRRSVRIIPPMLICYAVALALTYSGAIDRPIMAEGIPWDLLFLTNYASSLGHNSLVSIPFWSLDVEEHFYLAFPLIFILILRGGYRLRLGAMAGLLAIPLALRFMEFDAGHIGGIYYWTHTRFDAILYGVLLTIYLARPDGQGPNRLTAPTTFIMALLVILLTFLIRDEWFRSTIRYSMQGLALFAVFAYLIENKANAISSILSSRPLKVIADYSYVLYLIHMPLMKACNHLLPDLPVVLRYATAFIISFTFAAAMHQYVERPLLRWRRRLEERHSFAPAGEPRKARELAEGSRASQFGALPQ